MSEISFEDLVLQSEALIFASDKPLSQEDIIGLLKAERGLKKKELERLPEALTAVQEKYSSENYPFEVKESGGGYQFLSKKDFYSVIAKLNGKKFKKRLSTAAMESLAIIAYKQPCTKSQIEFVRGVNADYSVQKLLDLELIVILGRKEDAVGKPLLYGTSNAFMDYLGINSLEELPQLNEIAAFEQVIPSEAMPEEDGNAHMVVSENGELEEVAPQSEGSDEAELSEGQAEEDKNASENDESNSVDEDASETDQQEDETQVDEEDEDSTSPSPDSTTDQ